MEVVKGFGPGRRDTSAIARPPKRPQLGDGARVATRLPEGVGMAHPTPSGARRAPGFGGRFAVAPSAPGRGEEGGCAGAGAAPADVRFRTVFGPRADAFDVFLP